MLVVYAEAEGDCVRSESRCDSACQMAASAGFRVVVADWREAFCNVERFPGAETVVAFPEQLVEQLQAECAGLCHCHESSV